MAENDGDAGGEDEDEATAPMEDLVEELDAKREEGTPEEELGGDGSPGEGTETTEPEDFDEEAESTPVTKGQEESGETNDRETEPGAGECEARNSSDPVSLDPADIPGAKAVANKCPTDDEVDDLMDGLNRPADPDGPTTFSDLISHVDSKRKEHQARASSASTGPRLSAVEPGSAVLVVGDIESDDDVDVCMSAFDHPRPYEHRALFIDLHRGHPSRLDTFLERFDVELGAIGYIYLYGEPPDSNVRSIEISDPEDLAQLGISISTILGEWADAGDQIDICLESLTALLQQIDRRRVFRFLHILLGRIEDHKAVAHVHMDAETHATQTITLFEEIFDAAIHIEDH